MKFIRMSLNILMPENLFRGFYRLNSRFQNQIPMKMMIRINYRVIIYRVEINLSHFYKCKLSITKHDQLQQLTGNLMPYLKHLFVILKYSLYLESMCLLFTRIFSNTFPHLCSFYLMDSSFIQLFY
jgi:hypothetical protein